jgi:hypothetical protein
MEELTQRSTEEHGEIQRRRFKEFVQNHRRLKFLKPYLGGFGVDFWGKSKME